MTSVSGASCIAPASSNLGLFAGFLRTMMPMLLPRLAAATALFALARAQHQPPSLSPAINPGCDSEDELLGNLRWLRDACSQAGEQFDD
eukprot:COSAG06_NODE_56029_length_286_cov_5.165775_1_plen_88_part_01